MENKRSFRFPTPFHSVFGRRWIALTLVTSVALPLAFVTAGVLQYSCPIKSMTGVPCFGCGSIRSIRALMRGDLVGVWVYNPFAPVYLLVFCVLAAPAVVGDVRGAQWIDWFRKQDRKMGITILILLSHAVWGTVRIAMG